MLISGIETATSGKPEDKMLLEREWKRRAEKEKEKRMEKELEWTL